MALMGKEKTLFFFCVFFVAFLMMGIEVNGVGGRHHHQRHKRNESPRPKKLFVFGDSYADTGNLAKTISPSWNEPYGITFPSKPTGRFSDGRIFTDFVASFLGIGSPIPYKYRKYGQKVFKYGMNFAVGGTGVFDTGNFQSNLTVQIDTFEEQVDEGVIFSKFDLRGSTAVVSISGNDYQYYTDTNGGTIEGLKAFTPKLIKHLKSDLKRLHDLGVGKVAVTNLHPIGCTPYKTSASSYKECNGTVNLAVVFHNQLLEEAVEELDKSSGKGGGAFATINLFDAFMSIINQEMKKYKDALRPCCEAVSSEYRCGFVDENRIKKYTVCDRRDASFYWDSVHPTQYGWEAVFSSLTPSLNTLS